MPEHLSAWAADADFWTFRTADWWRQTWSRSGAVVMETADTMEDGWREWLLWDEACAEFGDPEFTAGAARAEADIVREDAGRVLTFTRVVASRK